MTGSRSNIRLWLIVGAAALMLVVVAIGGWTLWDAWEAGVLPWQPEPTRAAVTPFANLPTPDATP